MNSGELPSNETQKVSAMPVKPPCSVSGVSVLCPPNVHALPTHQCIIYCLSTKRLTCQVVNRSRKGPLPKSLIVVAERKSPNDSQDASHLNSRHLICRSFSAMPQTLCEVSAGFFVRCLRTLHEVSAEASQVNAKKVSYLCPVL